MNNHSEKSTITSLFVGSVVSLVLSLVLPRLIGWSNDLAGAAAATLSFAAFYILSLSLAFYLLGFTLINLKRLGQWPRVLGIAPILLVMIVGGLLLSLVR